MILSFDAAWGGVAWTLYDGTIIARGWKAFPSEKRTLCGLARWLELIPLKPDRIVIEISNIHTGGQQGFMVHQTISVRECIYAVAMWCAAKWEIEPEFVMVSTVRSCFPIPDPRPKGAEEWKIWAQETARVMVPGCLDGLGKKASEDMADTVLLAVSQYHALPNWAEKQKQDARDEKRKQREAAKLEKQRLLEQKRANRERLK